MILGKHANKLRSLALFLFCSKRGPTLPRPYADLIEDCIHELRIRLSGDQGRVFYFFCYRKFIVLTHAFVKTSAKVPRAEIKKLRNIGQVFYLVLGNQNWR